MDNFNADNVLTAIFVVVVVVERMMRTVLSYVYKVGLFPETDGQTDYR